jgi:protease I
MTGPAADRSADPPRVAILLENDFYEQEIFYYQKRFLEAGFEVHFITRLWGKPSLTFTGHEFRAPFTVDEELAEVDDRELLRFDALIVPSGMVADRLRYSETPDGIPPAAALLRRAFHHPSVLKGLICHGMWLLAKIPETVHDRPVTCHNNLVGDVRNMGARYVDSDVVVDGDLITGRQGELCHLFARQLIDSVLERRAA